VAPARGARPGAGGVSDPERASGRDPVRRPGSARYGWIAVVAGLAIVAYITLNTLSTRGPGSRGPAPGSRLPAFAAPIATSDLSGDANVAPRAGAGARVAACSVRDPRALNSCELAARRPAVLAFFATPAADCRAQLDTMQRVAARNPGVAFAAVAIRGDRGALRRLVRARGWTFPVAYDRDGAVANLYGIAVCPTVVFVRAGGRVADVTLGDGTLATGRLERDVRRLSAGRP